MFSLCIFSKTIEVLVKLKLFLLIFLLFKQKKDSENFFLVNQNEKKSGKKKIIFSLAFCVLCVCVVCSNAIASEDCFCWMVASIYIVEPIENWFLFSYGWRIILFSED